MSSAAAEAQVAQIRADIQRYGQSIVGCDKLLVLVSKNDSIRTQFRHIFVTAEKERWSFEFRTDGTVRFADLNSAQERTNEWNGHGSDFLQANELSLRPERLA